MKNNLYLATLGFAKISCCQDSKFITFTKLFYRFRYSAAFILFLAPSFLFAQCKYERNEIDDMTAKKVVITRPRLMINQFLGSSLLIKSVYLDGLFFLNLEYSRVAAGIFRVDKQAKIIFKLEDNSLIELENAEDAIAEQLMGDTWKVKFNIVLDDNSRAIFQVKKVIKIRVYTSKGFDDMEIKGKNQSHIIDLLKCTKSAL